METIKFDAPVDNNDKEWTKKKNYGSAALFTVVLFGMAFLAGNSYASYGSHPPTGSLYLRNGYLGAMSTSGDLCAEAARILDLCKPSYEKCLDDAVCFSNLSKVSAKCDCDSGLDCIDDAMQEWVGNSATNDFIICYLINDKD